MWVVQPKSLKMSSSTRLGLKDWPDSVLCKPQLSFFVPLRWTILLTNLWPHYLPIYLPTLDQCKPVLIHYNMSIRLVWQITQFSSLLCTIKVGVAHCGGLSTSQCNRVSPLSGAHRVIFLLRLQLQPQLTAQPITKKSLSCKRQPHKQHCLACSGSLLLHMRLFSRDNFLLIGWPTFTVSIIMIS